jgi:alpha-tubulin suppressor-like RCC1 family protein
LGKAKSSAAVEVDLPPAKAIAAGAYHTCAIADDGAVWCWGRSVTGDIAEPPGEVVPASFGATSITCGVGHCCAMTDARAVRCWGRSEVDQLGAESFSL